MASPAQPDVGVGDGTDDPTSLMRTFYEGNSISKAFTAIGLLAVLLGFILIAAAAFYLNGRFLLAGGVSIIAGCMTIGVMIDSAEARARAAQKNKIAHLEQRVRDDPAPQAAWDLARIKLEDYLDRNISQVSSIFRLVIAVMLLGFALLVAGVWFSAANPRLLAPALIASLSGIVIQFLGATFLVVYKSTMAQAQSYVGVLERINAVGMAIQILEGMDGSDPTMKNKARTQLTMDLIGMYSVSETAGHKT